jgi:hypothetical protein
MHPHHERAIAHASELLRRDPEVRALLLGGSIAHGFESPASDVDLLIVVSDPDHDARMREGRMQWSTAEACDWPGGYVEGKYVSPGFLAEVARAGSEPARFAFQDARVLFSDVAEIEPVLRAIARYPIETRDEKIRRFHAQFEAWHWYGHEALKRADRHLLSLAIARVVLFGGRMILAHNERLYPYHKWFLRVLEQAPARPPDLMERIAALHADPSQATLLGFWAVVKNFRAWEVRIAWPVRFLRTAARVQGRARRGSLGRSPPSPFRARAAPSSSRAFATTANARRSRGRPRGSARSSARRCRRG